MQTLSADEMQNLLEIIGEKFGSDLTYDEFSEAMLGLFEDISGFETMKPAKANRFVQSLWRQYHGQESR